MWPKFDDDLELPDVLEVLGAVGLVLIILSTVLVAGLYMILNRFMP